MNTWPLRTLSREQMDYMFGDFDKIIQGILRSNNEGTNVYQPKCDISESKDHYLASFDMPGVKKEDIKIEVQGNQLVVTGERRIDEVNLRQERMYGKFERTFNLPTTVDTEKIEAHYENGVLSIAIPKAETTKARTIQIQNGQDSFFSKLLGSKKDTAKELRDVKVS